MKTHCIVVVGDPAHTRTLVRESLDAMQCANYHFLNTWSMRSKEDIQDFRRNNAHGGVTLFIRAFLLANELSQMPEVLVFDDFNSISKERTYFIKSLLDSNSREPDECYANLNTVILIMRPDAFDIDPDIRGCFGATISLDLEHLPSGKTARDQLETDIAAGDSKAVEFHKFFGGELKQAGKSNWQRGN